MGGGSWTTKSYVNYSNALGRTTASNAAGTTILNSSLDVSQIYKFTKLDSMLDPLNVTRECLDSDEHPETIPVILALDVTGSMGVAAAEVAKKLNEIMTELYKSDKVKDVEFCIMAIGDFVYDNAPLQVSQFESDIRIAEQLDKVWFERGGGGNHSESYTAAWYFGLNHCKLDCWNRGKKGIIITLGDEELNPYLPKCKVKEFIGDNVQSDIETKELYEQAKEKFDIYHLAVDNNETSWRLHRTEASPTFKQYLDDAHFKIVTLDNLSKTISDIIINSQTTEFLVNSAEISSTVGNVDEISW